VRTVSRRVAVVVTSGLAFALAVPATPTYAAAPEDGVIANLWSWNWRSVAAECTNVLGPAGYAAVWVAPPAESFAHPNGNWWDVYQPYSYQLNGRFGDQAEFTAMTGACNAAGVEVYTDAVVNHTADQTGVGYAGTVLSDEYESAMYTRADYNVDVCDHPIQNWDDVWEVQHCELLSLPDLKTSSESVRAELASYLNSQIELGVSGFRIDAAKHMPAGELAAIVDQLRPTHDGEAAFVFHEVFPGSVPAPDEYYGSGKVLDFFYADQVKAAFQSDITQLENFGDDGLLPAEHSVSFVTNHDTERNGRHLTYKDGDTAVLANVFQLAWKRTAPTIYAGFEFENPDGSPPADANGFVTDTDCSNGWACLNRDPRIIGMVGWHNAVGDADVTNWQAPQSNVIGFGRGQVGFVALNNTTGAVRSDFDTGLPDGTYCNVADDCGTSVTVTGGRATLDLPAKGVVAFHTGERR
jgi:alpha-amylase